MLSETLTTVLQFLDIHDYMAYHHCTVASHKSSSVHMLENAINKGGRESYWCTRQKYVFSRASSSGADTFARSSQLTLQQVHDA